MPAPKSPLRSDTASRRDFLVHSAALAGATTSLALGRSAHAAGSDSIKIGLIGCGGRGSGAVVSALSVNPAARLTAMSDAFKDRMVNARTNILKRLNRDKIGVQTPGDQLTVDDDHLFDGIASGKPINDSLSMGRSTMLAILGRMATHGGQRVTWDEAINSDLILAPKSYAWNADPPVLPGPDGNYPVAIPGVTKVL